MPTRKKVEETQEPVPAAPAQAEPAPAESQDAPTPEEPGAASSPEAEIRENKEPLTLVIPPGHVIFTVTENIASLAHEGRVYPVTDKQIALPAVERWYDDLIQAGILKPS